MPPSKLIVTNILPPKFFFFYFFLNYGGFIVKGGEINYFRIMDTYSARRRTWRAADGQTAGAPRRAKFDSYGQFSKYHICFCGLDPGNLKFETVRTNKQHICFLI